MIFNYKENSKKAKTRLAGALKNSRKLAQEVVLEDRNQHSGNVSTLDVHGNQSDNFIVVATTRFSSADHLDFIHLQISDGHVYSRDLATFKTVSVDDVIRAMRTSPSHKWCSDIPFQSCSSNAISPLSTFSNWLPLMVTSRQIENKRV